MKNWLLFASIILILSSCEQGKEQSTEDLNTTSNTSKEFLALQETYDFDELNPSFYNEDLYEVIKDSTPLKVVEKYLRKDNLYLNYIRVWHYDDRGNVLEAKHLDTLYNYKEEVVCSAPLVRYKYDKNNNLIEITHWKNDSTKMTNDCKAWHKVESTYDSKGRVKTNASYSVRGNFLRKVKFDYNSNDQRIKVTCLDENDEVDRGKKGEYSIVLLDYDKEGRNIKQTYQDENGELLKGDDIGCFKTTEYRGAFRIVKLLNYQNKVLDSDKIAIEY